TPPPRGAPRPRLAARFRHRPRPPRDGARAGPCSLTYSPHHLVRIGGSPAGWDPRAVFSPRDVPRKGHLGSVGRSTRPDSRGRPRPFREQSPAPATASGGTAA